MKLLKVKKLVMTLMLFACLTAAVTTPVSDPKNPSVDSSEYTDDNLPEPILDLEHPY